MTINYLLGNLGRKYSHTVGVVDLGGGSIQMTYTISEIATEKASEISDADDTYVKEMYLKGGKYFLYVHSYLHYSLLAAQVEILKVESSENPCLLGGFHRTCTYGGATYEVSAHPSGSNMERYRRVAFRAVKVNESIGTHMNCTFGGIWNGENGVKKNFCSSLNWSPATSTGRKV